MLKSQKITLLCTYFTLLVSITWTQSNLQYMNIKFDKSSLSPSEIAQQGGKIMTSQQLLNTFQIIPDQLLTLKNIYIPIPATQQAQSQPSSTSFPKSTLSITENSNSNLRSVVTSTIPQNNLQNIVKPVLNPSAVLNKELPSSTVTPASTTASIPNTSSFSLSSQPSLQDSLDTRRAYFVFLTNNLRAKYGAGNLVINPLLNKIAQAHSDDMVNRQFFAHQNPDGEKVGDRAQKNGYTGMIGENLAQAVTLRQAQTGSQNSPTHFQNAINKNWQQIGVGIAHNGQTYLITVLFIPKDITRSPIPPLQLQSQRQKLSKILQQQNPNLQQYDSTLSTYIDEWLNSPRNINLMSYIINRGGYRTAMTAATYTVSYSNNYLKRVKDNRYFYNQNKSFSNFGIGIKQQGGGIQIYVVYM